MRYLSIGFLLLIGSCNGNHHNVVDETVSLHTAPIVVPLNTDEGYAVNVITGDSIKPIINSLGDTVKTGVPIPARGKVIDPDSVETPKVFPAGKPEVIPVHHNVHKVAENLQTVPIDIASLRTITPGTENVPSAVSIPAGKKMVPGRQPQPVKALPPIMRENASMNIKYLDLNQGMNSSVIFSIMEDRRGNMWFGSGRRGVSMYNGETFTHFTINEGLCDIQVRSILEDSLGNIWIATLAGVSIYDGEMFTHLTRSEGLINKAVWSMIRDSHGNFWFGTLGGLSMYDGETFTNYSKNEGLSSNVIFSILEDSQGNLWFGTLDGGVSRYNGGTFTHFTQQEGLGDNKVYSILEDRQGNIWFGTAGGASRYDGDTFVNFTRKHGLCDNHIRSILEDSKGNLWFGTNGGVSMFDGKYFTNITQTEGLSDNTILSIAEDSRGNLWFGTESGGVNIYYGNTFTHFALKEDLSNIHVRAVMEDSRGNIWFGSWEKGANRYDGETLAHFTTNEGLSYNTVFSILEDRKGHLWFGTGNGGVSRFDGESFMHFTKDEGLSDNFIWSILEDRQGNLWFGTNAGGVSMFNGKQFTHFTQEEGLVDNTVMSMLEDSQDNLWFGTSMGVSMYDGNSFIHYTPKEGLINKVVVSILEDSRGHLWIGSYHGGVSMFNGETFTYFTQDQGLSDNWVESIVEDSNHIIWLSTRNGLTRMSFGPENVSSPNIFTYGLPDGLKGIEFNPNSVLLDSKNRIWWGGIKGIIVLDINHLETSITPPEIRLERIDINGEFIDYHHLNEHDKVKMKFDGVARFYNYPQNLELPYNQDHLTFYFAAIDWSAPHKMMYSYLMEGLDEKWSSPSPEASAVYRNMPYGRYTFKMRSIGAAQKWSAPFEYTFRIRPPLWFTWWAYVLYGFILLLMIRWYRGFLINREKINSDLRIKELEVSKMQELDRMKSRFFTNISHEFRTPLTLIRGPIEELIKQFRSASRGSLQLLQTVKGNTERLQDLINQLLDISKLETGNVKLQVSRGNFVEFAKTIILSFISLAEYKKIRYKYEFPVETSMVYFDPDKIEKILTNLISNAFKFTPENGTIWVKIWFTETGPANTPDFAKIRVSDTGKGIPEEMQDKIFDRFYQVHDPHDRENEGTGLGLALTKELVELYGGDIKVESEPGEGSTFTVNLPVSVKHFKEEKILPFPYEGDTKTKPFESVPEQEDKKIKDIPENHIPYPSNDKPVILIVEDNAELREYISRNLGRDYRILLAENGTTGLDKALQYIPDLVISDVMMPVMDGMEMCNRLKTNERTDHIPVIILTAKADRSSKLEGLETGADDYLIKPFDNEELDVRVRNLLEQRRRLRERFRLEFLGKEPDAGLPPNDRFLHKLIEIFDQHLSDPDYKMDQLSGELNLSQSQVRRKVMATTGCTPSELFRNHRLKKSAVLFRNGHTHVAQVMNLVGFNNQSYFAKCFRELFEMTPSQFIRSQNNEHPSRNA